MDTTPDLLRIRLRNSLLASDMSVGRFAYANGLTAKSVQQFLDDSGKRRTQDRILVKIDAAVRRMAGPQEEFMEKTDVEPFVEDVTKTIPFQGATKVEIQEEGRSEFIRIDCEVTPKERIDLIQAVMMLRQDRHENYRLVKKLFPDMQH